ncbi:MAG: hypothetical protein JJ864_04795 [Rhizobiaceae bacterium]|nr:hypothetical protein [Rhizobiaceae bacterium]
MTHQLSKFVSAAMLAAVTATAAHAGTRIEKIGIAREGIDLVPARVRATSDGYSGFVGNDHRFTVRLFAKGKGNNNIHRVGIGNKNGMDLIEVSAGRWHYFQRTQDDGWGVYKTARTFTADMRKVDWVTTPGKLCRDNMAAQIAGGKSKSWVLSREWNLAGKVVLHFYAAAASPSKIRKGKVAGNSETRAANLFYPVNVVCQKR